MYKFTLHFIYWGFGVKSNQDSNMKHLTDKQFTIYPFLHFYHLQKKLQEGKVFGCVCL